MPTPSDVRCVKCQHFQDVDLIPAEQPEIDEGVFVFICPAYPEGIPQDILDEEDLHDKVRKDQQGNLVFKRA